MRAIIISVIIFSLLNTLSAQGNEDLVYNQKDNEIITLFGDNRIVHGGYGAFTVGYSEIENEEAVIMGGRGAWIISHWLALGFGGAGFVNDMHYNNQLHENVNLTGGYGGLLIEPIILPKIPIHISVPVLFGAGGIAYMTNYGDGESYESPAWMEDGASFLVLEPGVELEFNIVRFFRLSFGMTYRFTSEINLYDTSTLPLNCWSGNVTFKFGRF